MNKEDQAKDKANIVWHEHTVSREVREQRQGHRGCVVWFTGLSGSGKSTVANLVDEQLFAAGIRSYVLDGDNVRHGLNAGPESLRERHSEIFAARFGLGFSPEEREENIRRVGSVAGLLAASGMITLTAFVSPYRRDRALARECVERGRPDDFVEVFVDAPLDVCETRDPKGLYKKARAGLIKDFTGIQAPYEPPSSPEIHLDATSAPDQLAEQVIHYLQRTDKIGPS
ncbi:MAG: adenylyl-sulfate kinase [Pirellulaceae bacterium]|jgi:adenylylsulfate kinase